MKKNLLCAMLLVAGISAAHAQPTTWDFTYQGFVNAATGVFDSDATFHGSFSGEDRNADSVITVDELSYFLTQGHLFLPFRIGQYGCNASSYLRCEVNNFSYTLEGKLNYATKTDGHDEGPNSWYSQAVIGSYFLKGGGNYWKGTQWENRYNWSDQTTFTISPAPVPEPTVALMLPAGLALMYLARVRRRKTSTEAGLTGLSVASIQPSRNLRGRSPH
ncbi:PEP-CTERM sorting domain-containing protein [Janthinobacterium sp. LB2P49]|uniref:PEP-CTERM sorting domain-containing protein n=1 Tax=Janthinobacterium sp. LB2P49 TaxID=3424198 RepID=UPI003F254169